MGQCLSGVGKGSEGMSQSYMVMIETSGPTYCALRATGGKQW